MGPESRGDVALLLTGVASLTLSAGNGVLLAWNPFLVGFVALGLVLVALGVYELRHHRRRPAGGPGPAPSTRRGPHPPHPTPPSVR
ncbi:hypothetical protein [Puerhibacterium puerhi]|uniref:hypothetical protein n=1 Tax=Puerhibacterium puerhi TaxID=2692623 RepID=UPI00135B502E|nr:hypothetical protein [Puerhibacterium puerhi]